MIILWTTSIGDVYLYFMHSYSYLLIYGIVKQDKQMQYFLVSLRRPRYLQVKKKKHEIQW